MSDHPSFARLVTALQQATGRPRMTLRDVALAIYPESEGKSNPASTASNWRDRGVPSSVAEIAQRKFGISPAYVRSGEGDPFVSSSQTVRLDLDTIHRAMDFLEDLFGARGKAFDRKRYPLLLAAVVEDLMHPEPPSIVKLTMKYGGCVDAESDWSRDKAAGAG